MPTPPGPEEQPFSPPANGSATSQPPLSSPTQTPRTYRIISHLHPRRVSLALLVCIVTTSLAPSVFLFPLTQIPRCPADKAVEQFQQIQRVVSWS
mmetsp:Transcript_62390/g.111156  ORF Transcript_62390/g.111156 Transcript_62390/m.111156 type:complete len:95 (+) Transcript_62390:400-684(+)